MKVPLDFDSLLVPRWHAHESAQGVGGELLGVSVAVLDAEELLLLAVGHDGTDEGAVAVEVLLELGPQFDPVDHVLVLRRLLSLRLLLAAALALAGCARIELRESDGQALALLVLRRALLLFLRRGGGVLLRWLAVFGKVGLEAARRSLHGLAGLAERAEPCAVVGVGPPATRGRSPLPVVRPVLIDWSID